VRRWGPWVALALVLGAALVVGARGDDRPATVGERVHRIASELRCPTCRSISAAESDARASRAVRSEVARRVRAGQSDDEIRRYFVSRYGKDILLKPEAGGVSGLVWALPVVAGVCALAGLAVAFRRWRPGGRSGVSAEDRRLVEEALRS
jgi:cytochrome c-type biogenesis protein CcmH